MEERASGRRLARSTAIFSLATGLSRVLGLVREIVAAYYFGAAGKINAFTVAFQVPNLLRSLVADAALSSAFVPVFSELLEKGERKRAWRVASSLFWLMLLGLGALTALFIVLAPLVIAPFGDPGGDTDLAIGLSRVLFPIVVLLGVSGIVVGILNSYEQFTVPALTPVFWNLAIIAGLVLGVPNADTIDGKLYVYAVSIVIGTVIQVLLPLPWLRGLDGRLQVMIDWRDPAVGRVFVLMIPVTIGLGLINFNLVVNTLFASRFIDPELAPRAIDAAFRIYMLPQGMFSVAVATVLFPRLSRLATREDMDGFRHTRCARPAPDRLHAHSGERLHRNPGDPDHAHRLRARSLGPARDRSHGRRARRILARPHLQRGDVDAEPRLLQPADPLDADRDCARQPRRQHAARRRALPGRDVGDTARDVTRERFRDGGCSSSSSAGAWAESSSARLLARALRVSIASAVLAVVAFPVWYVLDDALGRSLGGQLVSLGSAFVAGVRRLPHFLPFAGSS